MPGTQNLIMKTFKFLSVSALVLVMAACGGKKEEAAEEVTDEETPVVVEEVNIIEVDDVDAIVDEATEAVEEVTEEAQSVDINALLKKYEKLVTEYVDAAKKVAGGDITAAAKMASLQKDYEGVLNDLEKVKGQMTAAQAADFSKISQKALDALK